MGHPPAEVLKYTPRQMWAYLFIANKRRRQEEKRLLRLYTMAARGEMKQVNKELKEGD